MPSRRDLSSLVDSAVLVLLGSVTSKVIILLERVILGNSFPVNAFGELTLGISLVTFTTFFTTAGLTQGVPRFIPRSESANEKRGIVLLSVGTVLAVSILVTGLLLGTRSVLLEYLFEGVLSRHTLTIFLLCIPVLTLLKTSVSAIRGFERTKEKVTIMDLAYPSIRLGFILLFLYLGYSISLVPLAYLLALLLVSTIALVFVHRVIPLHRPGRDLNAELLRFSLPLMLSAATAALLTKTDTFMLGLLAESYQVGLYSAGYPLAASLPIILGSFGFLYLPLISQKDHQATQTEVSALFYLTAKWAFVLTFPIFALMFAFPGDILEMLYGANYRPGGYALTLLATGFMIHIAAGRNRETISALGYPRYVLLLNSTALVINIVLNAFLIPRFGHRGAAAASALTFTILTASAYLLLRDFEMVRSIPRENMKTYLGLPLLILPIAVGAATVVELQIWAVPVVILCLYVLTFGCTVILGVVQQEDLTLVSTVERRTGIELGRTRRILGKFID